jgi:hypothetical protein
MPIEEGHAGSIRQTSIKLDPVAMILSLPFVAFLKKSPGMMMSRMFGPESGIGKLTLQLVRRSTQKPPRSK